MTVAFLDLTLREGDLERELDEAARRVLRSGRYILGPEVERFEAEFASYCGATAAVGVGTGLDALRLALEALGIGPGNEVIVSAHTAIATWLAISHTGALPVPVEPNPSTMQIDPARAEAAISSRSAALVPVHLYGMPAEMEALLALARRHGLAVVADASQAHGARLGRRSVGAIGDAVAFSLYPTKNLGAFGDAGILVSDDLALIQRVRMLANYGERHRHRSELCGYNSRLDELQAALLSVKLSRLDRWNERRRDLAARYLARLAGVAAIRLPGFTEGAQPVWHQFVIRVSERDRVRRELGGRGIETLVHYPTAPHQAPAYASREFDRLPITERLVESVISLPISPLMSDADCERVCEALAQSVAVRTS